MHEGKLLSVCMITYNDEPFISDALREIGQAADEIIVADIGSEDHTVERAGQAGASVFRIPWENDFSKVKNFCMDQAGGRWILFLQADESISEEHVKELRTLLDDPSAEGFLLYISYQSEQYAIFSPVQSMRLLRNREEYRYQYRSFELIPEERMAGIKQADIQILYRHDVARSWRFQYQLSLLQEDLLEHPESCYLYYIYGMLLMNQQRYEESIIPFQIACNNVNYGFLFAPHLLKCQGLVSLYLGQNDAAMDTLNEGIAQFPYYTDLLAIRAEVYRQFRRFKEAVQDLELCFSIRSQANVAVPVPEIDIPVLFEMLGGIYEQLFHYRQALDCVQQAYDLDPTNVEYVNHINELTMKLAADDHWTADALREIWTEEQEIPGEVKRVIWAEDFMKKIEARMGCFSFTLEEEAAAAEALKGSDQPDGALLNLYHAFLTADGDVQEKQDDVLTCSDIHGAIGDVFLKSQRNGEALYAYLRALQWNPLFFSVQDSVKKIAEENPNLFDDILEHYDWIPEGIWFQDCSDFSHYIRGLVYFRNEKFELAFFSFSGMKENKTSDSVCHAYRMICLWMEGKETETELRSNITMPMLWICKDLILSRLSEAEGNLLYDGMIEHEEEKVQKWGNQIE